MSELVRAAVAAIVDGKSLSQDDARLAMGAVMDGEATPSQLAALLMGLRMRGETVDELAGFAAAMRERAVKVEAPEGTIDVVGTGGDGSGTFNISTTAALVVAAMGVPVAKHGNRAITSKAGSADVLDALGVRIDHDAESAGRVDPRPGLRVPVRAVVPPGDAPRGPDPPRDRRPDRVQPARAADQPGRGDPRADRRGRGGRGAARRGGRGAPGHGADVRRSTATGSTSCRWTTRACSTTWVPRGSSGTRSRRPSSGSGRRRRGSSPGGDAAHNAKLVEDVLRGEPGARRDVVLLNAAAALLVAGFVEQLEEGIDKAALAIDAGVGGGAAGQAPRGAPGRRCREARAEAEAAAEAAPAPRSPA